LDSSYNAPRLSFDGLKVEKHILKTDKDYKRYLITDDGVSPRGLPGYGEGLIAFDSNEHGDTGRNMDEDPKIRTAMNAKRLRKLKGLAERPPADPLRRRMTMTSSWWGGGPRATSLKRRYFDSLGPRRPSSKSNKPFPFTAPSRVFCASQSSRGCGVQRHWAACEADEVYADVTVDHKFLSWSGMEMTVEELLERLRNSDLKEGKR
jgi:2-oxoglutarate ferredoxin oxidoreductase subunit alpha